MFLIEREWVWFKSFKFSDETTLEEYRRILRARFAISVTDHHKHHHRQRYMDVKITILPSEFLVMTNAVMLTAWAVAMWNIHSYQFLLDADMLLELHVFIGVLLLDSLHALPIPKRPPDPDLCLEYFSNVSQGDWKMLCWPTITGITTWLKTSQCNARVIQKTSWSIARCTWKVPWTFISAIVTVCVYTMLVDAWYLRYDLISDHFNMGISKLQEGPELDFLDLLPGYGITGDKVDFTLDDPLMLSDFTLDRFFLDDDMLCGVTGSIPTTEMFSAMLSRPTEDVVKSAMSAVPFTPDEEPRRLAIMDTGATRTSIGNKDEFKSLTEGDMGVKLKGIAAGLDIKGKGIVEYNVRLPSGEFVTLRMHAFWVPALGPSIRLISPQGIRSTLGFQGSYIAHTNENFNGEYDPDAYSQLLLREDKPGWQEAPAVHNIRINYHPSNNLPMLEVSLPDHTKFYAAALSAALDVTDLANRNLDGAQKILLQWHFKLGHIGFNHLKWLIRTSHLPSKHKKLLSSCVLPKCAACEFAKAKKRPTHTSTKRPDPEKESNLKKGDLLPGQRVSVDHYQSALPGRLYTSRGSTPAHRQYSGGVIFVDHATGHIDVRHQVHLDAAETIEAKIKYEREAYNTGVIVQQYHTDNGIFGTAEFVDELLSKEQTVRFSGVGAPHMNGIAERSIQTVVYMARTMMLHAAMRAPEGFVKSEHWPMAMDQAVWLYNRIPRQDSGCSPHELWSRTTTHKQEVLSDCHVWGCPVYVLEPSLQKAGVKIPKWNPRSRRGVNLGFSKIHSSLIGLVLNLLTGSISAQWHVVYDDTFSSVHSPAEEVPEVWNQLLMSKSARRQVTLDEDAAPWLADEWLTADERAVKDNDRRRQAVTRQRTHSQLPVETVATDTGPSGAREETGDDNILPPSNPDRHTVRFDNNHQVTIDDSNRVNQTQREPLAAPVQREQLAAPLQRELPSNPIEREPHVDTPPSIEPSERIGLLRRSTRLKTPTPQFDPGPMNVPAGRWTDPNVAYSARHITDAWSAKHRPEQLAHIQALLSAIDLERSNSSFYQPFGYAAGKAKSDPDEPTLQEGLSGDHAQEYWDGMATEIDALTKRNTWTVVPRSKVKPGCKVVPGKWVLKAKRRPDGTLRKFKSRYTVRGDIQKRQSSIVVDTYAPVVQWASVRLMLVLTIIFRLATRQIDFSNAFAQTDIPATEDVYVEMPSHFSSTDGIDSVLKLNKALYGQLDSPKRWWFKIRAGLIKRGLVSSTVDPCLFISKHIICMCYVDDICLVATSQKRIDDFLQTFKDDGDEFNWEMTEEGTINDFLGIKITRSASERTWTMTQTGLIDKVLAATGMTNCNAKETPTSSDCRALGTHKDSQRAIEKWSYRSILGMTMYLASNSRPDISFAVHQCARFSHDPKVEHEQALLRICRYLKGTRTQGLILRPSNEISVDCYVDADFLGLYGVEDVHDPMSARSRTGFVILLANCPLAWTSVLQPTISVSTLESEWNALSASMRALIPMKRLVGEVLSGMSLKPGTDFRVATKSQVFEDNAGVVQLATTKKMTSRTRHMAVKMFWFMEKLGNNPETGGEDISIIKVASKDNMADIFTKSLGRVDFCRLRHLLCGW